MAGYRVGYLTGNWSSPFYEVLDEFHYSPPLAPHREYEVRVCGVDIFGREGYCSWKSTVLDPAKLLLRDPLDYPFFHLETWDEDWITNDDLRELRDWFDAVGILDPTPTSDSISGVLSVYVGDYVDAGFSVFALIPYLGDVPKLRKLSKLRDALRLAKEGGTCHRQLRSGKET